MLGFKKAKPKQEQAEPQESVQKTSKPGFFSRLVKGVAKTRSGLTNGLASLLLGKKEINEETLEEVETLLLSADVGVDTTQTIIDELTAQLNRKSLKDGDAVFNHLKQYLAESLEKVSHALSIPADVQPYVILMVGINGAGKTTTIGKLAKQFQAQGKSVLLAAGDTFRAAAVEQLQTWGERNDVPVIAQNTGADSASVIYDAISAAKARGVDVVIADTAGRLHTQVGLMEELKKIKRVIGKFDENAPHEVNLVLDAGIGQNALNQAQEFQQAVGVTGLTLTKLDGTAKGGIIFAISNRLGLPIRFIGVGEGIDDLRPFDAKDFINALFEQA